MIAIASYPRSGNHLVRFVIEHITGRPTLGCLNNPLDVPIHRNSFPDDPDVLQHVAGMPIGCKAHSTDELNALGNLFVISGLILVCRSPVEAILAQVRPRKLDLRFGNQRRKFTRNARWYFDLLRHFDKFGSCKITVSYENLISSDPDACFRELDKIAALCGPHVDDTRFASLKSDFERLKGINARAKDRAWSGYISGAKAVHYQTEANVITLALLKREIGRQARLVRGGPRV